MVVVIILLHALITINFAATWSHIHSSFIKNGHFFGTVYLRLNNDHAASLEMGIPAFMSAIITDFYMVCIHRGLSTSAHHCSNSRFGVAGWFGDDVGLLFCLQYFP